MKAVLFDFSGTLARLEEDDSWFDGMGLDATQRAEVMDRLTHPTASVAHHAWDRRDLDPVLHREAYLHVLGESGLSGTQAESLYARCIDPAAWVVYPDTVFVLNSLRHKKIGTAVVSNIAWDVSSVLSAAGTGADHYVLSYQVGTAKPDRRIFESALSRLGVEPDRALMIGDSEENDGAARALGAEFVLVDPLPPARRPTGLLDALRTAGVAV